MTAAEAQRIWESGDAQSAASAFASVAAAASPGPDQDRARLAEGVARQAAGDSDGASTTLQALVDSAPSDPSIARQAAYALGKSLVDHGAPGRAVTVLTPFAKPLTNDAFEPFVIALYAKAAASVGDVSAAESAWTQILAHPATTQTVRDEVLQDRVAVARDKGDRDALRSSLDALVRVTGGASARFELAHLALADGDSATFVRLMVAILEDAPASRLSRVALAELQAAGVPVSAGTAGLVLYRSRQFSAAREVLLPGIADEGVGADNLAFRRYYLAASYEDDGFPEEAIIWYDRAAEVSPGSIYAHRARYWAARVAEGAGRYSEASARYSGAAASAPAGEFTGESAFRAGYTLWLANDRSGAIAAWEPLSSGNARVQYWLGVAYRQSGASDAARQAFQAAVDSDPTGFYGAEAGRQLTGASLTTTTYAPVAAAPIDWNVISAWAGSPAPDVRADAIRWLAGAGDTSGAASLASELAAEPALPAVLSACRAAETSGLTSAAIRCANRLRTVAAAAGLGPAPGDLLRVEYPLRYVSSLNAASLSSNVDPLLFAALIRQESLWDPAALSPADAFGLAQIIPETGAAIADSLGLSDFTTADLLQPVTSITFGANYLGSQLKRFGNPYLALAAYNAGPGNALRWSGPTDPAQLLETIDFTETHAYVELVIANYARYNSLYRGVR